MKKGIIIAIIAILAVVAIGFFGIVALIAVPNLTGIQDRSQVNADIRTAEQIGKTINLWRVDGINREVPTIVTEYDKLEKIEEYISAAYEPTSLKNAEFYVISQDGKIKVAIAKEASDVNKLDNDDTYEGKRAGWAYVEGQY